MKTSGPMFYFDADFTEHEISLLFNIFDHVERFEPMRFNEIFKHNESVALHRKLLDSFKGRKPS